jgi:5'-3' exonuclease
MSKLIIIDGSSLLSTSFFGNLPSTYYKDGNTDKILKTTYGLFTNGVLTMTKILLNIIKNQKPTHMAIAWDISRNTFRKEMYTDYKAQRKDTKPELREQYKTMQDLLEIMNIKQFKFPRYEADDILGTLSKKFEDEITVYIMTKDQDALQLITEKTRVWLLTDKYKEMYKERNIDTTDFDIPDKVFEFTPLTFEEVYGLKPIQMIDKKAIEGDTSDNIPGVKGVGEKAVVPLLQEFGTIEDIYNQIENMTKEEDVIFKELLKDLGIQRSPLVYLLKTSTDESEIVGKKAAFLSKELATICTTINELSLVNLNELKLNLNEELMQEEFNRLEFKSLLYIKEKSEVEIKPKKEIHEAIEQEIFQESLF